MTSDLKYSWAIKQKSVSKIEALTRKLWDRKQFIISNIKTMKRHSLVLTKDFIESQLQSYLYECYRHRKSIAVFRSVANIQPLVSEEIYNAYTFEKFVTSGEGVHFTKQFYSFTGFKD